MGIVSRKFNQRIKSFRDDKVIPLQAIREAKKMIEEANFPKPDDVKHLDPAHGIYVHVFNTLVAMLERLAGLPELEEFCSIIEKADEEYMPSGPPMSPLTRSYFNSWAFLDLQVGRDKETFASVIIDAAAVKPVDREFIKVLRLLAGSRMGLYEYLGVDGDLVRLRELITKKDFTAHTPLTYRGQVGELWLARLMPPPFVPISYWTIYTTPYVFSALERPHWDAFISRSIVKLRIQDPATAIAKLFKFGFSRHYWNEFIFEAYKNHIAEACFLTGMPDDPMSRPHSREYQAFIERQPSL